LDLALIFVRHLLVEQHAKKTSKGVRVQEFVGGGIAGDVQSATHGPRAYGWRRPRRLNGPAFIAAAHFPSRDQLIQMTAPSEPADQEGV